MRAIGNGFIRRIGHGVRTGNGQSKNIDDWRLGTDDDAAIVEAAGFFNAMANDMVVGSCIQASLDLDGAPLFKTYMVTANTGTVVTIAAATA